MVQYSSIIAPGKEAVRHMIYGKNHMKKVYN
jgi:hypothetical protein